MTVCDALIDYVDRTWDLALRKTLSLMFYLSSRRDILAMGLGISFVIIWFFSVIDIAVITIFTVLKHESIFQSITFGHCL